MNEASLFDYYREMNDSALLEAYRAGEESYRPSAWAIIAAEVARRKITPERPAGSREARGAPPKREVDIGDFATELGKDATELLLDNRAVQVLLRAAGAVIAVVIVAIVWGSLSARQSDILVVAATFGAVIGGILAIGPEGFHRQRALRTFVVALVAGAFAGAMTRWPPTALTFAGGAGEATVPSFMVAAAMACILLSIPHRGSRRGAG